MSGGGLKYDWGIGGLKMSVLVLIGLDRLNMIESSQVWGSSEY